MTQVAAWVPSIVKGETFEKTFSTGTNTVGWTAGTPRIAHTNTNDKSMKGRVAEVLMWNRVLDDTTERKAVIYAYLNARYGFSLPT